MDCVFCKIANGEIPTDLVYEDEWVAAINDIEPMAPIHILFVPKKHIASSNAFAQGEDAAIVGHIFEAIAKVAKEQGFAEDGYRVVTNCGTNGGQSVPHLHFHVLGGKKIRFLGFDPDAK